jgi:hypothetical protein
MRLLRRRKVVLRGSLDRLSKRFRGAYALADGGCFCPFRAADFCSFSRATRSSSKRSRLRWCSARASKVTASPSCQYKELAAWIAFISDTTDAMSVCLGLDCIGPALGPDSPSHTPLVAQSYSWFELLEERFCSTEDEFTQYESLRPPGIPFVGRSCAVPWERTRR